MWLLSAGNEESQANNYRFLFNFSFFGRPIEFFAGIALGMLYKRSKPVQVKSIKFTLGGIFSILLCVLGISLFHTNKHYGDYYTEGIIINNLILPIGGIAVLYWGLLIEKNFITKILSSKIFDLLGKSSYAFYLIHLGILADLFLSHWRNPVLFFVFINLVSIILYRFYEFPLNRFFKKVLTTNKSIILEK